MEKFQSFDVIEQSVSGFVSKVEAESSLVTLVSGYLTRSSSILILLEILVFIDQSHKLVYMSRNVLISNDKLEA